MPSPGQPSSVAFVFKATALSVAAMIAVFFGVGLLLADRWEVTTVRTLPASPDVVRRMLGDLRTWPSWYGVKVNLGEPTASSVEGEPGTPGHQWVWTGPLGTARLVLLKAEPAAFEFEQRLERGPGQGEVLSRGSVRVAWRADGEGTSVSWRDGAEWNGIMLRWFGWFGALQEHCRTIQSASLEALRAELERKAAAK